MRIQEVIDRGFRFFVIDDQTFKRRTGTAADILKAGTALIDFTLDNGADAEKEKLPAAQCNELFCGHLASAKVVRGDTGDLTAKLAVDAHNRDIGIRMDIRPIGQGNDAVDLVLFHKGKALFLGLRIKVRNHHMRQVTPVHQTGGQLVNQHSKERMPHGGHQESDAFGPVGFQASGIVVHPIIESRGGLFDPFPIILADGKPIENTGNRTQRDARLTGNIFHGWLRTVFHRFQTSGSYSGS